ncbi:hypothetical protein [Flavobacterium terrisoli]|uniref:hypothetical protein n=1 Tax=Flavobacterium terrisoli TaxID=3242195 RepID=UPI002542F564|nr:hypothetical protein [Flavobacterium buctense]
MQRKMAHDDLKVKRNKIPEMDFFEWFIIFIISTGIIVIERFTPVYINNFYIRLLLYIISASLLSFWISWILFGYNAVRKRVTIFIVVVIVVLLKAYLTWGGSWKTQTILYTNKNDDDKTIEFQMRGDRFAFGYKKRIVERKKIMPFLDYVTDTDTTKINTATWKRIDKKINQLELKGFNDIPSY